MPPSLITAVVVCFHTEQQLLACLESLIAGSAGLETEIVVVAKGTPQSQFSHLCIEHPLIWLEADRSETVPSMRRRGAMQATGTHVALLEADCEVSIGWWAAIAKEIANGTDVIGGAVEPMAFPTSIDWSVFLCEYSPFMLPYAGVVARCPCNNIVAPAEALRAPDLAAGLDDGSVHASLKKQYILKASTDMQIKHRGVWSFSNCTVTPYHHGRAYGASRFASSHYLKRTLLALLTPIMPAFKITRVITGLCQKRRFDVPILKAIPGMLLFETSWSLGEFLGYLLGPGDSVEKWV